MIATELQLYVYFLHHKIKNEVLCSYFLHSFCMQYRMLMRITIIKKLYTYIKNIYDIFSYHCNSSKPSYGSQIVRTCALPAVSTHRNTYRETAAYRRRELGDHDENALHSHARAIKAGQFLASGWLRARILCHYFALSRGDARASDFLRCDELRVF